jgi:CheY-like chemotaxis protein
MPNNPPFRILVVEDDPLSRDLLSLLLTREGYAVDAVDSGDAALQTLRNTPPLDAVLTDLQMPGISGSALAHRLREVCGANTTLLAMSASGPAEDAQEGFDGFLRKPFTVEALAAALAKAPASPEMTSHSLHRTVTVLDEDIYGKLSGSMRSESLFQLYSLCLTDARKREVLMRQAAAGGDDATYRREAHAIKGSSGMVGAAELQTLAASMEETGITTNHVATLDEFLLACDRLHRMLIARRAVPDNSAPAEGVRSNRA